MDELKFYMQGDRSELNVYKNRAVIVKKPSVAKGGNVYNAVYFCDVEKVELEQLSQNTGCIGFYLKSEEIKRFYLKKNNSKQDSLTAITIKAFIDEKIKKILRDERIISSVLADGIKKYKELFDCGVITQEEFELKKKQLSGL